MLLMVESWGGKTVEGDEKWGLKGGFRSLWSKRDGGQTIEMKRSVGEEGDLEVFQSLGQREEEKKFGGQEHWGNVFPEMCSGEHRRYQKGEHERCKTVKQKGKEREEEKEELGVDCWGR